MSPVISMHAVGATLKRDQELRQAATLRGLRSGARRGLPILVRATPKDQGLAQISWKTVMHGSVGLVATNENSAPHIGILENGARPHKVSWEGIFAIYQWVERHFRLTAVGGVVAGAAGTRFSARKSRAFKLAGQGNLSQHGAYVMKAIMALHPEYIGRMVPAALNITGAIIWKIATKGQAPKFFVRGCLLELNHAVRAEVERCISEIRPGGAL